MSRKKWILLILCVVAAAIYVKLFYKTYSENSVVKNADCIVAIDIKRIINTVIWNTITTPSQWKISNIFKSSSATKEVSWQDMIEIPDYVLAFHVSQQPASTFYVVLTTKNETDFNKGLLYYNFTKRSNNIYSSKQLGIQFFKNGDKILLTNTTDSSYLNEVAQKLFTTKEFITKEKLNKAIGAKSHLAIYIAANKFLQQDAIATANFDKQTIKFNSIITPNKQYSFTQNNFSYSPTSLCTVGFTQPSAAVYNLLSTTDKNNISKAIGINIDSLLRHDNTYYHLDIAAILPRVDSAITYTYDDNFNEVKKIVANKILEPAFNFTITGDSITKIYNHFLNSKKIEQTDTGQLFTAMPFVKSYCNIKNEKELKITAANYLEQANNTTNNCIFFINTLLSKIPAELLKYLPDDIVKAINNIELIAIKASNQNEQVVINCILQKKKNDLPIIKL